MKAVYTVENIDCPNCAAKIERAIAALDEVEEASLSYAQGLLHVTAKSTDGLLEKIQAASDSVEEGAVFAERRKIHPHSHVSHHGHKVACRMCDGDHQTEHRAHSQTHSCSGRRPALYGHTRRELLWHPEHLRCTHGEGILAETDFHPRQADPGKAFPA